MKDRIVVTLDAELAEIVPGYLQYRRDDVAALTTAVANGDYETICRLGHQMKGSGGGYGFDVITAIGAALERAAVARDDAEIRCQVAALADFVARVQVVYK